MDYNAPYAKERLTGRGYFLLTGATQLVDLGNIEMFKVDFGIKRKEHFAARRGVLSMDRYDAYASQALWTLTCDEFVSPLLAYAWSGPENANFTQTLGSSTTLKGAALDIGKYGLFSASLTTPAGKVEGYSADYVIDRGAGKIYFPLTSTLTAGASVVTYSCPALTYDSVTALQILNRNGSLEIHGEDDSAQNVGAAADAVPPSRYVWTVPCILTTDSSGEFKPDDYRKITILCTATSAMTVKRLQ